MASRRKMIIITSNEDVIRRFTRNKAKDTHIIDLDHDKQETSIETDDQTMLNLPLFAELSELNSTNDYVYKRALDFPQDNPSKPAKVPRKSSKMICAICGDDAIGYNYDVSSCASCKTFFHRNANQNIENIRCLSGEGQCSVVHEIRRKCPKCRLERCVTMGMRKDFMLSDEEKQRRRRQMEEKRKISSQHLLPSESTNSTSASHFVSSSQSSHQTTDEMDCLLLNMSDDNGNVLVEETDNFNQMNNILLETLPIEDWITVESVRSAFLSTFQTDIPRHLFYDVEDRTSALINWSYIAHEDVLRFITFCRQISEFESLDADDRFILIKYHLVPLHSILQCFYYQSMSHSDSNEEVAKEHRFCTLCFDSDGIRETFMNVTFSLVQLTEQDPAILSLLLTILVFYPGLSMNEDEPLLKDPLKVNQAQSSYTRVLCNYMNSKWGEVQSSRRFSQLLILIFRMQSLSKKFRDYFRAQFTTSDTAERVAPLMQSALNIC